jgi:hypothetical protein
MTRVPNKEVLKLKLEFKKSLKRELNISTTKRVNLLALMICKTYTFKPKLKKEKSTTSLSTRKVKLVTSLIILKPEDHLELLNDS